MSRRPRRPATPSSERRTALALLAGALGMVPLKGLFSDYGWIVDSWVTMIVVIGPALWLRRHRAPGALDIWPGIILLVPWLTLRFVPQHAIGGFIPTAHTWHDISALLTNLHETTRSSVAPIHTTVAVRLVVCALLGLLAALIDLIAVVGRRGALAGVPLLVVYTVSGAVPRHAVSWLWFLFAALGYLILLGLDAGDELEHWGRRFRSERRTRTSARWSVATPRIAAAAIVIAIVAPLAVPGQTRNLIADAFHGGGGTGVGGFGGGSSGTISPFAALKGQLNMTTPTPMANVHIAGADGVSPFYLRVNVLAEYTSKGFQVADHGQQLGLDDTDFTTEPLSDSRGQAVQMQARISVSGLSGNAPIFAVPTTVSGLDSDTTWTPQDQILLGSKVHRGQEYIENFRQPTPTVAQLNAATGTPGPELASMLELPSSFPSYVHDLVTRLTKNESTPYAQARAINNYFTDPKSGFVYDLKTQTGDSGSILVDFLKNKRGFCQQYAAAMAVMLRDAKIPSRVVLGYMHNAPDDKGNFEVSSSEAHAWVEAYFNGIGWIPFDPTPSSGLVGGSKTDLPWAPHSYATGNQNDLQAKPKQSASSLTAPAASKSSTAPATTSTASPGNGNAFSLTALWWTLGGLALVALVLSPALARSVRRRRRYQQARRGGDADSLWLELSDTAVDLGYVWSPARSPRQVASWLARDAGGSAPSLQALAAAVERGRYSPSAVAGDADLARGLREVTGDLRAGRSLGTRVRAVLWPASLGWGGRLRSVGRRRR